AGWGGSVATNTTGANMPAGHVAALVASPATHVALESDEAWLPEVMTRVRPRVVVLLNLSRDQLDRASEVRQMAERWRHCLESTVARDVVVVANANDPLVVYAVGISPHVRWCDVPTYWLGDAASCPRCTEPLVFDASGWRCRCGFARPADITTSLGDTLNVGGVEVALNLAVPGSFNRSNAAMAVTALAEVGVAPSDSVSRIASLSDVAGRFARRRWRGRDVRVVLAKNPAGVAALLADDVPPGEVWVAINDRVADGHDPSWLYDAPFERLRGRRVVCLGERRLDLATRLDYAGVDARVVDDPTTLAGGEPAWLIANYTAFAEWLARSEPA
ncbi:MAG: MurT ligase domain-containing protein, partial [Acidimicrobiales bacterium]